MFCLKQEEKNMIKVVVISYVLISFLIALSYVRGEIKFENEYRKIHNKMEYKGRGISKNNIDRCNGNLYN